MYSNHFNLEVLPFESTPDPAFFYPGPQYRETLAAMIHCVASRKSLMVVSGPIGSGKTTLGRTLTRYLSEGTQLISILHPFSARGELISFVAHSVGLEELTGSKLLQVEELNKRLVQLTDQGKRILIIIDEAQLLTLEDMEEIRLLTNLETETIKLVQIILLGQSELIQHLQIPEARPLRQRLASVKVLKPLERSQVMGYVRHRLKVAGGDPELFSEEALQMVASSSGGIPRLINQICDQSLLNAFAAESQIVDLESVRSVVEEMTAGQSLPAEPEVGILPGAVPGPTEPEPPAPVQPAPEPPVQVTMDRQPEPDLQPQVPPPIPEIPREPLLETPAPEPPAPPGPTFETEAPAPQRERLSGQEPVELVDVVPDQGTTFQPEPTRPEPVQPQAERERNGDFFMGGFDSRPADSMGAIPDQEEGVEIGPIFRPAGMDLQDRGPERQDQAPGEAPGAPLFQGAKRLSEATQAPPTYQETRPDDNRPGPLSRLKSWAPAILLLILALVALGASLWIFFNYVG